MLGPHDLDVRLRCCLDEQYLLFLCLVFPCPPSGRVVHPLMDTPFTVYILGSSESPGQTNGRLGILQCVQRPPVPVATLVETT